MGPQDPCRWSDQSFIQKSSKSWRTHEKMANCLCQTILQDHERQMTLRYWKFPILISPLFSCWYSMIMAKVRLWTQNIYAIPHSHVRYFVWSLVTNAHKIPLVPLQWHHNGRNGISNHQPHDCLLNWLFRRRWKTTSKLRVTGLCEGNSPVTGEFPAQMASNAENVSIWWRHHVILFFPDRSKMGMHLMGLLAIAVFYILILLVGIWAARKQKSTEAAPDSEDVMLAGRNIGVLVGIFTMTGMWLSLTHLPLDKMAAISGTIFSDAFSWMNSFAFWLKFHWSLFLSVQLRITQCWLR